MDKETEIIPEMKGWKVIKPITRKSCRASEWPISGERWAVTYPVNEEVFPLVKGSKLFFFGEKKDAEEFMQTSEIIVPCIAKNAIKD